MDPDTNVFPSHVFWLHNHNNIPSLSPYVRAEKNEEDLVGAGTSDLKARYNTCHVLICPSLYILLDCSLHAATRV